jgi:hypothetical protein
MTAAGTMVSVAGWLSFQSVNGGLESSGLFWIMLAVVAAGALLWMLAWSCVKPLYLPRARPAHHFRRARQKELRPR